MKATRRWKAQAACTALHGVAGQPRSPSLSSSSCLGTRWPRANRTVCVPILSDDCDHHAV
eukprot:2667195-Prymnesium_polylepis.1